MHVREIMKVLQSVRPDEYGTHVRALLRESERILSVMEDTRFLGVITRKDAMVVTSSRSNVKARDIMTSPLLTVGPDEEIHDVGRKMIENDVYSIPVVENSRVLGVVHVEDVTEAVYKPLPKKVRDIMTGEVVFCDHAEEITKVWKLMEYHNFTGLPITEEVSTSRRRYRKLVGFVTQKDMLRAGEARPSVERFTHPPAVEKIMTRTPKYVHPDDSVDVCVQLFRKYKIGRLPVVQNEFELVGIVDREDILRMYVGGLP